MNLLSHDQLSTRVSQDDKLTSLKASEITQCCISSLQASKDSWKKENKQTAQTFEIAGAQWTAMTGIDPASYLPAMLFISEGARGGDGGRVYYLCDKDFWSTEGYHWPNEPIN